METIIKKAIEGRCDFLSEWKKFQIVIGGVGLYDEGENFVKRIGPGSLMPIEQIFMQKEFWQALGKVCRWDQTEGKLDNQYNEIMNWNFYALNFHNKNLNKGLYAAIEYLESIIK